LPRRLWKLSDKLGFPSTIYKIVNNNYFLEKYYEYLRRECGYTHSKQYYKRLFSLHLLGKQLRSQTEGLRSRISGL